MELSKHEHHRVLQAHYSTGEGFEFQFYCQECFHPADHPKLDDIERILNEHAVLKREVQRLMDIDYAHDNNERVLKRENKALMTFLAVLKSTNNKLRDEVDHFLAGLPALLSDTQEYVDCPKAIGKPRWCKCHGFQYPPVDTQEPDDECES